jgi:hypothetical protein
LDATLGDDVPQELAPRDSEGAFFQVQLNAELPEVDEGFFQIGDEPSALSKFYHDVINVNLELAPYLLFEAKLHTSLVCSPRVLFSGRYFHIAKTTEGIDEHGNGLEHLGEGNMLITRVGVQETQELRPDSEVYNLVDAGKGDKSFIHALFGLI